MSGTGRAPKRNVLVRRARREAEHRRRERTFWAVAFFGWMGALYAWFTNSSDRARQQRFEAAYRRRADVELDEAPRDDEALASGRAEPLAAPQPRDRQERDALRREARRRRLVRTVVVVGALLILNFAYFWFRLWLQRH